MPPLLQCARCCCCCCSSSSSTFFSCWATGLQRRKTCTSCGSAFVLCTRSAVWLQQLNAAASLTSLESVRSGARHRLYDACVLQQQAVNPLRWKSQQLNSREQHQQQLQQQVYRRGKQLRGEGKQTEQQQQPNREAENERHVQQQQQRKLCHLNKEDAKKRQQWGGATPPKEELGLVGCSWLRGGDDLLTISKLSQRQRPLAAAASSALCSAMQQLHTRRNLQQLLLPGQERLAAAAAAAAAAEEKSERIVLSRERHDQLLMAEITEFAMRPCRPLTLNEIATIKRDSSAAASSSPPAEEAEESLSGEQMERGRGMESVEQYLSVELPVRFASRIKQIEAVPLFNQEKLVMQVRQLYVESFKQLRMCDWADKEAFTTLLKNLKRRHAPIAPLLVAGLRRLRHKWPQIFTNRFVDDFLDTFFLSRIGTEMLTSAYLSPRGIVDMECDPMQVIKRAALDAERLCHYHYGCCPRVLIWNNERERFACVPQYLYYILFELFKNAMRATVERACLQQSARRREVDSFVSSADTGFSGASSLSRYSSSAEGKVPTAREEEEGSAAATAAARRRGGAAPAARAADEEREGGRGGRERRSLTEERRARDFEEAEADALAMRERNYFYDGIFLSHASPPHYETRTEESDSTLPPIQIVVSGDDQVIAIKMADQGGGISQQHIDRIWSYMYTTAHPVEISSGDAATGVHSSTKKKKKKRAEPQTPSPALPSGEAAPGAAAAAAPSDDAALCPSLLSRAAASSEPEKKEEEAEGEEEDEEERITPVVGSLDTTVPARSLSNSSSSSSKLFPSAAAGRRGREGGAGGGEEEEGEGENGAETAAQRESGSWRIYLSSPAAFSASAAAAAAGRHVPPAVPAAPPAIAAAFPVPSRDAAAAAAAGAGAAAVQPSPLAGFGCGLPLSRLYASYLGGRLDILSLPFHGSDAYLYLNRIGDKQEKMPPNAFYGVTFSAGNKSR